MRSIFSLFLLCLFSFVASAQDYNLLVVQKDRSALGFRGAAIQVAEEHWVPAVSAVVSSAQASHAPDSSYSLEHSAIWVFDSTGRTLSVQRRDPDERKRKSLADTGAVFYYSKGKLVAIGTSREGKRADSVAYRYLRNGLPDQYLVFDRKGELQYKITYTYKNGQVSMMRRKDKDNMVIEMIRYQYNNGRLAETRHFDRQLRLMEIRRYSTRQDGDGEQGSYAITGADGKMKGGVSWRKDATGRILEENQVNSDREVTESRSYIYDAQTDPMSEKVFSAFQESDIAYRYTYDEQGNWTRKEAYDASGLLRSVTLRTIRYGH